MAERSATLTARPPHRWILAVLAVAVPVLAGAAATAARWPAVPHVDAVTTLPVATFSAPQVDTREQALLHDGSVVVPWPLTGAPITVRAGETLELALAALPGESVSVLEPQILATVRTPTCHAAAVCAIQGGTRWSLYAAQLGIAHVHIDYGLRCRPMLCGNAPVSLTVTVVR